MTTGYSVITEKQAREITGGRKPLVPIEYEAAINALVACTTLDEAKYWSTKADALAAWANIYHSKEVEIDARRLKLHAFRRMGQLAAELRPIGRTSKGGSTPGPVSLLRDSGLNVSSARAARVIAKMPAAQFESAVNSPRPPTPNAMIPKFSGGTSQAWQVLRGVNGCAAFTGFASWCKRRPARDLARNLLPDEARRARQLAVDISEWLDEFERFLPKATG